MASIFDLEWRSYRGPTSGKCYIDTSLLDFDFRIWKNICAFENIYLKKEKFQILDEFTDFLRQTFLKHLIDTSRGLRQQIYLSLF